MVDNVAGFVLVRFFVRCSPGNSDPDCIILIFSEVDGDLTEKEKLSFTSTFRLPERFYCLFTPGSQDSNII